MQELIFFLEFFNIEKNVLGYYSLQYAGTLFLIDIFRTTFKDEKCFKSKNLCPDEKTNLQILVWGMIFEFDFL